MDIINLPEGKTLEFKQDSSSPLRIMKTLVAFANTAGGKVVVGVTDDKKIIGVEDPLLEEERLCNLIADTISSRLVPNIEFVSYKNKTLLIIEVFLSNTRPHYLNSEGIDNGVYVRLGSTNRKADREMITELKRSVQGGSYDALPMPELSIEDLDLKAMQDDFHREAPFTAKELQTLKLLVIDQGKLVPTHGAVLLYGIQRSFHFSDAWIQCGRFLGTDKVTIFDQTEIHDHLPQAVDSIMLFLKKHAYKSADFSEIRRKDIWSIPIESLREIIINALVHTDYSQRGAPVRIAFYDDRIEVENPGILLPGMTIEDMKLGVSRIRNSVIVRVFKELNLIEQWGSGLKRVFADFKKEGLPEPKIEEIGMRMRISLPLAEPHKAGQQIVRPESPTESPTQSPTQSGNPLSRMLSVLNDGPKSSKEIRDALDLSHRQTFRENYLHPALEQGLIKQTIPEKPNSRLQKYKLTEKGKEILSK